MIKYQHFLADGAPITDVNPRVAGHYVYFTSMAVDATGKCAVIEWAGCRFLEPRLILRDFTVGYFTEKKFAAHSRYLAMCYSACSARRVAALVPDIYEPSERDIITDFGFAAISAGYVESGDVKIAVRAHDKSQQAPLGDALDFRFDRLTDPLPCAALSGVYMGLHPHIEAGD